MTASRRWRAALASAASTAILIGGPLIGAQAASAQPYPPPPPPLSVSATTVAAGEQLTFSTVSGVFAPGALVTALLESTPVVLGHFRAQPDGSVAGTVTIPVNTITGWHVFRLTSHHPHPSVGVSIYVLGRVTPTPTHKPPHHPGNPVHHDEPGPGGHNGHGGNRDASLELAAAVEPTNQPQPDQNTKSLAATGSHEALVIGGTAAALLVAGGGTMLAVRRRRSS
ncbi:LPXTG cell wall anchor domain-containing protein [Streptomyces sp. NY05-11A]|uniref:LPXTG cell wall anchor domain-containing protein n=1 Tax=Streptomyces soliscabiei TaxID=588897 RepID=UPI0029BE4929|nr:LPXTG cell wall anchor domain-containing protein [Streptomyces sp. NY05-11A]MDX2678764.1 LPXTG cell wall anchor domain-containing protein [Streptomyces sp. NY05-11A]